jgi:hypothetical protein
LELKKTLQIPCFLFLVDALVVGVEVSDELSTLSTLELDGDPTGTASSLLILSFFAGDALVAL